MTMPRRDVLKTAALAAGCAALSPGETPAAEKRDEQPAIETDVLVIGGGTAGVVAALQSARAGARTLLVEKGSQLGGTMTTGGVNFPGLFHAWCKQIIAGIGWELVTKTVDMDSGRLPDFSKPPKRHWMHQVRLNAPLYAALAEEACLEAGVDVRYYEFPLSGSASPDGWRITLVGPGTKRVVAARQLVDCTGGADVCGMLGFARLREKTTQPGTLMFRLTGYDARKLDNDAINKQYREALKKGLLKKGDTSHGNFAGLLRGGGGNAQHTFGADSSTSETMTASNIAGRQSLLRTLRFARSLPGCEKTRIGDMQEETAVRETYRIVGEALITRDDYVHGRMFDDAVCYAFYPIDLHDEHGVRPEPLAEGMVPTVPLRALIPKGSRNLIVAGRCVSSDRLANSALRVQASCMAMGQAAGAAAALAAVGRTTPGDVPFAKLTSLLKEHMAIVPEKA